MLKRYMMNLRELITEPELRGLDIEDKARISLHAKILSRKPMLRGVFEELYRKCIALDRQYFGGTPGLRVELGAGTSNFKKYFPEVIITDIVPADHLDAVVDAQEMPFGDGSVRALYGMNFFHHLAEPERFLNETMRVLAPGGGCVFMEPYWGPVASQFYKYLHATESFDKSDPNWASKSRGAMLHANQALSYMIFRRDRVRFEKLFPKLEIVYQKPESNYLRYLCSGGLNFRPLFPNWFIGPLKTLEKILIPLLPVTALYHFVVLRKRGA